MTDEQLTLIDLVQQILDRARRGELVALALVLVMADAAVHAYG